MAEGLDAVVAGHLCLDILPSFDHISTGGFFDMLRPGSMIEIGPAGFSTGGTVSNTGLALHQLGISTRLVGKIGNDLFGGAVQEIIGAYNPRLTEGLLVDRDCNTSYTLIINPPGIDRIFLHNPGANKTFSSHDVDFEQMSQARLFHFGYPPVMQRIFENEGADLVNLYRKAKETGVTTSLDICMPAPASPGSKANWPEIYRAALPYVDIFLPNIEELMISLRPDQYHELVNKNRGQEFNKAVTPALLEDVSSQALDLGVKIMGIKLGEHGFYLHTAGPKSLQEIGRAAPTALDEWAGKKLWASCFRVKVAGTTGAGDATVAGFLAALLKGLPAVKAVTMGVAVGACNVEAADSLSGIRGWETTCLRIASGWERHELKLNSPTWHWNPDDGLWVGQ